MCSSGDDRLDLSVIVVSHDHGEYLPACLDSLRGASDQLKIEVIVVENKPNGRSAELVREHYPRARVVLNRSPRGYAANNNLAIRRSGGRYVLLLNPDSLVLEGSLGTLVAFMDEHPDVGICGPKVRFPDGRIQLSCRRFPTWRSALARRTPLRSFMQRSRLNTDHLMADVDHDRVQEVDWMIGACLLARRAAIDQVGLLDEGFFLYVEDIDWCYRMWQGGWRVVYVPTAQVVHHLQAVSERRWLTRRTLIHYSSIARFLWKHRLRPVLAPLLRMT